MKRSIISTIAATVLLGFAGMLAAADSLAATPAMPEISIPAFDEAAAIEEVDLSPSIGRTVIYQAHEHERSNSALEHPAIITSVHNDTCVNLKVLPDCGAIFDATSAVLDGSDDPRPGTWRWPERV